MGSIHLRCLPGQAGGLVCCQLIASCIRSSRLVSILIVHGSYGIQWQWHSANSITQLNTMDCSHPKIKSPWSIHCISLFLCITHCIEFAWSSFGSRGATGVDSVSCYQKLPPCPAEPMPPSSKMDLLLAKAEPINSGGSTSGITYIKREIKQLHSSSWRD